MRDFSRSERRKQQKKLRERNSNETIHKSHIRISVFSWVIIVLCLFLAARSIRAHFANFKGYTQKLFSSSASYEEKMMEKGWPMQFYAPAKDIMPKDAIYVYPSKAVWLTLGNAGINRYFLTPRIHVPDNRHWIQEQDSITHVFRLENPKVNMRFPYYYVPAKNIYLLGTTRRNIILQSLSVNGTDVTDLQRLYSQSEIIESNQQFYPDGRQIFSNFYGKKIANDYVGKDYVQNLTEDTNVNAVMFGDCIACTSVFAEVAYSNGEKIIIESFPNKQLNQIQANQEKKNLDIKGNAQFLKIDNLFLRAQSIAKTNKWSADGMQIKKVGLNIGKAVLQTFPTSGIIEVENGIAPFPKEIEDNYKNSKFYFTKGHIYKNEQQWKKSIGSFVTAYELNPHDPSPLFEIGIIATQQKQFNLAIQMYQQAVSGNQFPLWAQYGLGEVFREKGEYDKAIEYYYKASKYLNVGNYDQVVENFYQKVLDNNSNGVDISKFAFPHYDGFVALGIGQSYEALKNIDKAKKYYTFIAWNIHSLEGIEAWRRLKIIAPELLKIMPIP